MTHHEHRTPGYGEAEERKDPVCGMTVEADSPHRFEHEGTEYLFCSADCKETFRKEPARYAA